MSWIDKFKPAATPQPVQQIKEPEKKEELMIVNNEPEMDVYKDELDVKPGQNISSEAVSEAQNDELSEEDKLIAELEAKKAQILEAKRIREEEEKKALENAQSSVENTQGNELERVLMSFEARLTSVEAALFRLGVK